MTTRTTTQTIDITLRLAATLACELDDGELVAIRVANACVEDDRTDLLTGAHYYARRMFAAALRDLVVDYEHRTKAYSRAIEFQSAPDPKIGRNTE